MRHLVVAAALAGLIGCGHGSDPATGGTGSAPPPTTPQPKAPGSDSGEAKKPEGSGAGSQVATPDPDPKKPAPPAEPTFEGHDFTPAAKELAIIGACFPGDVPAGYDAKLVAEHCKKVNAVQTQYADSWVKKARPFFEEKVPKTAPKKVVYPFSGGDLSTALTVYPDADEITTMSLEPAGDPRTLQALNEVATGKVSKSGKVNATAKKQLEKALGTVRYELDFLYRVNFSNTSNMIDAMRLGSLPTQLIFGLSALKVHGYELVSVRYFKLDEAGNIVYLTDEDLKSAPDPVGDIIDDRAAQKRNNIFSNSEIRFRKPGGKIQVHRHIRQDLGDKALGGDGARVVKHLEQKGQVVAMTKAASYLLSYESFSTLRNFITGHAQWMVSDATGVAPKWGTPAGFEYETYGSFAGCHIECDKAVGREWVALWAKQEKRPLKFRFGYYDSTGTKTLPGADGLVIMKKK